MGFGAWLKGRISLDSSDVDRSLNRTKRGAQTLAQQMAGLKGVLVSTFATGMLAKFVMAVKRTTFEVESLRLRFSILFKDTDKAARHTADLLDFASKTPFQMEGISKASLLLYRFSDGAMGGRRSLELVGDAAAAAGRDIEEVSFWVGRAYGFIQGGRPFGEAAMRLQEMGILGAAARNQMEALQKSGASNAAVWNVLYGELTKNAGGMKQLSESGKGLESTLKDELTIAANEAGEVFRDAAKGGIQTMIDKMQELREDGSIGAWAEMTVDALGWVWKAIQKIGEGWGYIAQGAGMVLRTWQRVTAFMGAYVGSLSQQKRIEASGSTLWDEAAKIAKERVGILNKETGSESSKSVFGSGYAAYRERLKAKHQTNRAFVGSALSETDASIAAGLERKPSDALEAALADGGEQAGENISDALKKALDEAKVDFPEYVEKPAASGGVDVSRDSRRFDSLREIGANILGSGRVATATQDRDAEIARATQQTAENTARLVDTLARPPVSRLADSSKVY